MSITSFYFLCLFALALLLYYLIPKKVQWPLLLLLSIGYFLTSAEVRDSHAWYLIPVSLYTSPSPRDGLLSRMPSSA